MNHASVNRDYELSSTVLAREFPGSLQVIFTPQHGLWGEQQANMIESTHAYDRSLDIPVYSLYSETRRPTEAMLDKIDCLLVDLQDVGTRVYTFIWTVLECLHACTVANKPVIILDRPNPLGGTVFEGPLVEQNYLSFVGGHAIPLRHGLTLGEIAKLFVREVGLDLDLQVVPMRGWQRQQSFHNLGRPWIWPSPNMPTLNTVFLYPGQVLLEGTNVSEGRGSTRPFELIGAPFLDATELVDGLAQQNFPGVHLRPTRFCPTFDKWHGHSCEGLELIITSPNAVRSVELTVTLLFHIAFHRAKEFSWLPPPYEYEYVKPPIDILWGNDRLRTTLSKLENFESIPETVAELIQFDESSWRSRVDEVLLYH